MIYSHAPSFFSYERKQPYRYLDALGRRTIHPDAHSLWQLGSLREVCGPQPLVDAPGT